MAVQRKCPSCGRDYPETQTNCVNASCPDTPAALAPGTVIPASLILGEYTPNGIVVKTTLANEQFTNQKVIGWGAMASVCVMENSLGHPVVVKEIRPQNRAKVQQKFMELML